jgi:VIT1/CCC1 family predicted Fe2+/Mn2+ transporter
MKRCVVLVFVAVVLFAAGAEAEASRVVLPTRARVVVRAKKFSAARFMPKSLKRGLRGLVTPGNLRASLMGLSDGVTSTFGVVAATTAMVSDQGDSKTVVMAGTAALIAGASSMSAGEYSSVAYDNEQGLAENPDHPTNSAEAAAASSFVSFIAGAAIPLSPVLAGLEGTEALLASGGLSTTVLVGTGHVLARMSGSHRWRSRLRLAAAAGFGVAVSWLVGGQL